MDPREIRLIELEKEHDKIRKQMIEEELARMDAAKASKANAPSVSAPIEEETMPTVAPHASTDLSAIARSALLDMATEATKGIMDSVRAKSSKLNKDEIVAIGAHTERLMAVLAAMYGRLTEAETKLASEAKFRAPVTVAAAAEVVSTTGLPPMTYADRLKSSRQPSMGPTLAFYPREEAAASLPTADATKALLKKTVAPAALNIYVENVRKVGRAGVIIQTRTAEDARRLKEVAPASLQVKEPQKRDPLVALRGVDNAMSLDMVMAAVHEQNFKDDKNWPLEDLKKSARLAFKKGRPGADRATFVVACSPALRRELVKRERIYIGWEVVECADFTVVVCCRKCQQYGHQEAKCAQKDPICAKCGVTGHKSDTCTVEDVCCATCKKFGHTGIMRQHRTAARDCPARVHAERRLVEATEYR